MDAAGPFLGHLPVDRCMKMQRNSGIPDLEREIVQHTKWGFRQLEVMLFPDSLW